MCAWDSATRTATITEWRPHPNATRGVGAWVRSAFSLRLLLWRPVPETDLPVSAAGQLTLTSMRLHSRRSASTTTTTARALVLALAPRPGPARVPAALRAPAAAQATAPLPARAVDREAGARAPAAARELGAARAPAAARELGAARRPVTARAAAVARAVSPGRRTAGGQAENLAGERQAVRERRRPVGGRRARDVRRQAARAGGQLIPSSS
jgi:hypothetical protein